MKRLMFRWPLMAEAGAAGGGGQAGNGEPGTGNGVPQTQAAPASAAAQMAGGGTDGQAGNGEPGTGNGVPQTQAAPASAAAQLAGQAGQAEPGSAAKSGGEPKDIDLAATSDEDYAKLVMPDVKGGEAPDRSLITPMAKELRAAGIQPSVMAKIAPIYRKVVEADIAKAEAERAARMKELTEKCLKEVTEDERRDFAAVYRDHISKDAQLKELVDHTELGSSAAFIRIMALAGATLRVETTPPASGSAGSGRHDTDRAVFEATVPAHLR